MNKSELVTAVAKKANATKVAANEIIDALIDVITNAVKKGDEVRLVLFDIVLQFLRRVFLRERIGVVAVGQ